jgi:hypothetical protein
MCTNKEYLTSKELANRLSLTVKSIQNKKASGVWKEGVHYVCPPGMAVRWKWTAIIDWMERPPEVSDAPIPVRRQFA